MRINQITPKEENGEITELNVYFNGQIAGINFNGNIPIDPADVGFDGKAMKAAVRQKVVEKIMNGEDIEESAE